MLGEDDEQLRREFDAMRLSQEEVESLLAQATAFQRECNTFSPKECEKLLAECRKMEADGKQFYDEVMAQFARDDVSPHKNAGGFDGQPHGE